MLKILVAIVSMKRNMRINLITTHKMFNRIIRHSLNIEQEVQIKGNYTHFIGIQYCSIFLFSWYLLFKESKICSIFFYLPALLIIMVINFVVFV